jgi:hypothetical protein
MNSFYSILTGFLDQCCQFHHSFVVHYQMVGPMEVGVCHQSLHSIQLKYILLINTARNKWLFAFKKYIMYIIKIMYIPRVAAQQLAFLEWRH